MWNFIMYTELEQWDNKKKTAQAGFHSHNDTSVNPNLKPQHNQHITEDHW